MVISGKLRDDQIIKNIEHQFLGDRDIYKVAAVNGWNHRDKEDAIGTLEDSCQRAKKGLEVTNRSFTELEIYTIIRKLVLNITASGDNRKICSRVINKETQYEAIKFLNAIASSVTANPKLADQFFTALSLETKNQPLLAYNADRD